MTNGKQTSKKSSGDSKPTALTGQALCQTSSACEHIPSPTRQVPFVRPHLHMRLRIKKLVSSRAGLTPT